MIVLIVPIVSIVQIVPIVPIVPNVPIVLLVRIIPIVRIVPIIPIVLVVPIVRLSCPFYPFCLSHKRSKFAETVLFLVISLAVIMTKRVFRVCLIISKMYMN